MQCNMSRLAVAVLRTRCCPPPSERTLSERPCRPAKRSRLKDHTCQETDSMFRMQGLTSCLSACKQSAAIHQLTQFQCPTCCRQPSSGTLNTGLSTDVRTPCQSSTSPHLPLRKSSKPGRQRNLLASTAQRSRLPQAPLSRQTGSRRQSEKVLCVCGSVPHPAQPFQFPPT
jgi:hypothetical protein